MILPISPNSPFPTFPHFLSLYIVEIDLVYRFVNCDKYACMYCMCEKKRKRKEKEKRKKKVIDKKQKLLDLKRAKYYNSDCKLPALALQLSEQ